MENVAKVLKAARARSGLTAREVGALIDVDQSQVYKWEKGVVAPRIEIVLRYVGAGLLTPNEAMGVDEVAA